MGPKNKKRYFAQNRFFTLYIKLKSSASRSRISVSEGLEPPGTLSKKFPKVPLCPKSCPWISPKI